MDQTVLPVGRPNMRIIKRENTCFDLGAHAEVLTKVEGGGTGRALKDRYKRFILMNASIRGPFVPHWSKECWSDAYLGRLNEKVKVGLPQQSGFRRVWKLITVTARRQLPQLPRWYLTPRTVHDLGHRPGRSLHHP